MQQDSPAPAPGFFSSFQLSAWCMLAAGLIASLALFFWTYSQEQGRAQAMFERRAQVRSAVVRQGMNSAVEALQVLNQLFVTNKQVSPEQFHTFTQPLQARFPYIELFSFRRLLSQAQRAPYEARMRRTAPGFTISELVDGKRVPAAVRDQYRIIEYVEPVAGNEFVIGLDTFSQPFQEPVRRTEDTGRPVASGLFRFYKNNGAQRGFRILMAVYQDGAPLTNLAARRRAVIGYTVALLRAGQLVDNILKPLGELGNADLDMRVYAAANADESQLVYGASPPLSAPHWWAGPPLQPFADDFDLAGVPWHVVVTAQATPLLATHASAFFALLAGLLMTFAGSAYLQSLTLRTRRIQQLVALRTDELRQVNQLLLDDIAGRKLAEEALHRSRSALRRLADHQESVKEKERKRIARDIHDELGQNLLVLRLDLSRVAMRSDSARQSKQRSADALQQVDVIIKAVRAIINDLRPGVLDLGLPAAVEWQARKFERYSGIPCDLSIEDDDFAIDDPRATALFRILQEALSNIMRHAKASRVHITLQHQPGKLCMEIADNGMGLALDAEQKNDTFGLAGMAERIYALKGTFATASNPGQGLTIKLSIPLPSPPVPPYDPGR